MEPSDMRDLAQHLCSSLSERRTRVTPSSWGVARAVWLGLAVTMIAGCGSTSSDSGGSTGGTSGAGGTAAAGGVEAGGGGVPGSGGTAGTPSVPCDLEFWTTSWERGDAPILQAEQAWEGLGVNPIGVLPATDGARLYYYGASVEDCQGGVALCAVGRLGHAVEKGGQWVRTQAAPILDMWQGGAGFSFGPGSVVAEQDSQVRYFHDRSTATSTDGIFSFTSGDGLTFATDPGVALLTKGPAGAFDDREVASPAVVRGPDGWLMLYTGTTGGEAVPSIGLARSTDGVTWARVGTKPAIGGNATFASFGVRAATVVRLPGCYLAAYSAVGDAASNPTYRSIAMAVSTDGENWQASSSPSMEARPGQWDGLAVRTPVLHVIQDKVEMFYVGFTEATPAAIGIARHAIAQGRDGR